MLTCSQGSRPKAIKQKHFFFRVPNFLLSFATASSRLSFLLAGGKSPEMALLAGGLPRPPALLVARRRYRGSEGTRPAATDRLLCRSPPRHLLVSPVPAASSLPLYRICQRRGQRTSLLVTRAAAAAAAAAAGSDRQEQPRQTFQQRLAAAAAQASKSKKKEKKKPLPARLLSSFLATSSVPYR